MPNKIEFANLKKQYNLIKKEIDAAIKKVLDRGEFVGGKEVEDFEKEMAMFCGVKYAIGVNSGTDALFLSLKALEIKTGDEVITTPFTFIATAEIISNLGAKPVFADIDEKTFNIDSKEIEKKITKKTKAIIPVHLFGQTAEMDKIMTIAKKHNLYVIEDTAQAVGAKRQMINGKWQMAGSIGNCGCFSFFPLKNLGGYGDGGMIITNDKKIAEKIRLLRNHGSSSKDKYRNLILGINSRLDTLQAAVLRVKLKYLNRWNNKRREIADYYNKELKKVKEIIVPEFRSKNHVFNQYTIRAKNREGLKGYLEKKGIETKIYYPLALHLQPTFKYLKYKKGDFPFSEKASKEVLSLPIYPELAKKEQDFIIKSIKDFYKKNK